MKKKDEIQTSVLKTQLARALADYDNLVKRVEREKQGFERYANVKLAIKLLPVLDVLREAQKHIGDPGIAMTITQFEEALKGEGIEEIAVVPLSEALIKGANHGAIAVWTVTGFGYASEYTAISKELFNNLFKKKNLILGSATTQAKVTAYSNFGVDRENLDIFILIGDPASSLLIEGSDSPVQSDKGSEGGKCFIATAAYGSSLAPHVRILREFRDRILMKFTLGERIVGVYNRYSPPLAVLIEEHDSLKPIVRLILLPIIGLAWFTISGTITHIFIVLTLTGSILMVISLNIIKKI